MTVKAVFASSSPQHSLSRRRGVANPGLLYDDCLIGFDGNRLGQRRASRQRHYFHFVSSWIQLQPLRKITELVHMPHVSPVHIHRGEVIWMLDTNDAERRFGRSE